MLDTCHDHAQDYSSSFNASKYKSSIVLPNNCRFIHESVEMSAFQVGANPIEFVDHFVGLRLGHVITNRLTDNGNILIWRHCSKPGPLIIRRQACYSDDRRRFSRFTF